MPICQGTLYYRAEINKTFVLIVQGAGTHLQLQNPTGYCGSERISDFPDECL